MWLSHRFDGGRADAKLPRFENELRAKEGAYLA